MEEEKWEGNENMGNASEKKVWIGKSESKGKQYGKRKN